MISVLIPIYNFNITSLVEELHKQLSISGVEFEVLCYDDGSVLSFKEKNKAIAALRDVRYMEMDANLGRSKIRNRLAADAKYDFLLFMDCDSKIASGQYVKNYLENLKNGNVVFGGRCYDAIPPPDRKKYLRWRYGMKRESIDAEQRQAEPYRLIFTNNILIPRKIFAQIVFDETVTGYGYEDSAFGFSLKKLSVPVKHINNPLYHIGLEDADIFLEKTKNALNNLLCLKREGKIGEEVKILRYYNLLNSFYIAWGFLIFFKLFHSFILKNIHAKSPSLFLFDVYRLGILLENNNDS